MDFEINQMPKDETDKEPVYELYFNKGKVLIRNDLKAVLDKIKALVEVFYAEPKEEKKK